MWLPGIHACWEQLSLSMLQAQNNVHRGRFPSTQNSIEKRYDAVQTSDPGVNKKRLFAGLDSMSKEKLFGWPKGCGVEDPKRREQAKKQDHRPLSFRRAKYTFVVVHPLHLFFKPQFDLRNAHWVLTLAKSSWAQLLLNLSETLSASRTCAL